MLDGFSYVFFPFEKNIPILIFAILLDRLIGDPSQIWGHIPHPVVLFGKAIFFFEKYANKLYFSFQKRLLHGWIIIIFLLSLSFTAGFGCEKICSKLDHWGILIKIIIISIFLAQKSLAEHVIAVFDALKEGKIEHGRAAVSLIVGRNPHILDEISICRAAIESLAENSSDGVIAPAFWFLFLGLPGLFAYKMLNTSDSMIGHKNSRYMAFGYATAYLDDLVNHIPARLTAFLTVFATKKSKGSNGNKRKKVWETIFRDAHFHRSPNAGWPESAFASSLGIKLAGPRQYGIEKNEEPFLNVEGRDPNYIDIFKAIILFWRLMNRFIFCLIILYLITATFLIYSQL